MIYSKPDVRKSIPLAGAGRRSNFQPTLPPTTFILKKVFQVGSYGRLLYLWFYLHLGVRHRLLALIIEQHSSLCFCRTSSEVPFFGLACPAALAFDTFLYLPKIYRDLLWVLSFAQHRREGYLHGEATPKARQALKIVLTLVYAGTAAFSSNSLLSACSPLLEHLVRAALMYDDFSDLAAVYAASI